MGELLDRLTPTDLDVIARIRGRVRRRIQAERLAEKSRSVEVELPDDEPSKPD